MAKITPITSREGPPASGGYAQACLVEGFKRVLHVSGQIPVDADGAVPAGFEEQARLVWKNVERQLTAAQMGLENIVKHTTYLASRDDRTKNSKIRQEILGSLSPALTVIIAAIYDEAWLLEIEVVAMA
jgi:2-iminobutanoate/2-iminopropanoate deaminase